MTLIGGSRRQVRVNRVGFAVSRFTPDSRPSSEGSASPKRAKLQTYNLADDAAGESKRIVLGSRWLGGTLHAEAGRSCTVRRRLIGVRARIYDRLGGDVPPHWIILNERVPRDSCYIDLATQDKKGEWRGTHRFLCRCCPTFAEPLTTEEAVR